jgi:mitofilin
LIQALDEKGSDDKESQWKQVTDIYEKQSQVVSEAKRRIQDSTKTLEEVEALINDAKKNELFKNLKTLRASLKEVIEQQRAIVQEDKRLKEALIHANVLRTYTKEQKAARSQFLREIQALQPEGIPVGKAGELGQQESNNLLIHAHRRVNQLQSQLEKMQVCQ